MGKTLINDMLTIFSFRICIGNFTPDATASSKNRYHHLQWSEGADARLLHEDIQQQQRHLRLSGAS